MPENFFRVLKISFFHFGSGAAQHIALQDGARLIERTSQKKSAAPALSPGLRSWQCGAPW